MRFKKKRMPRQVTGGLTGRMEAVPLHFKIPSKLTL